MWKWITLGEKEVDESAAKFAGEEEGEHKREDKERHDGYVNRGERWRWMANGRWRHNRFTSRVLVGWPWKFGSRYHVDPHLPHSTPSLLPKSQGLISLTTILHASSS